MKPYKFMQPLIQKKAKEKKGIELFTINNIQG